MDEVIVLQVSVSCVVLYGLLLSVVVKTAYALEYKMQK